jgi:hypothetical protein
VGKVSPLLASFAGGEQTEKISARSDISRYSIGCRLLSNFYIMPQGGVARRQGFKFASAAKFTNKDCRLIPFKFSTTQAYQIECGDQYFRFYRNNGQILNLGLPYEVATPYLEADIRNLKWSQSADVLYICNKKYRPKKLTRTGHTNWTLTDIVFTDGPYLDTNATTTTLTPSAVSGASINITASSIVGINGGVGFLTTDIGRLVRIKNGTNWGNAEISTRTSALIVTARVNSNFSATTANTTWALGLWSETTGWPAVCQFYEDRLWFGGSTNFPQTLVGSFSGAYENMSPTDLTGAVTADNALVYTISTDDVNSIEWLSAGKILAVLTNSGEFSVSASNLNEAITPTNIKITRETTRGAASVRPARIDSALLFWQRSGRKLREFVYSFQDDQFKAPDLTILAEHISRSGIKDMDYQQEPSSIAWACLNNGTLLALTYNREQEIIAWARQPITGLNAKVLSVACTPATDGTYDELWIVSSRSINGATATYIEYLTKEVEPADEDDKEDLYYVDCGLTYTGAPATVFSGMQHLAGEVVSALVDGAPIPNFTMPISGSFTLSTPATTVHVGLPYKSVLMTNALEAGGETGTSQGKLGRINKLLIKFYSTLGCKFGPGPDPKYLQEIIFRKPLDPMGVSPPLFTGDKRVEFMSNYETQRYVYVETEQPLPCTILGLAPEIVVYA